MVLSWLLDGRYEQYFDAFLSHSPEDTQKTGCVSHLHFVECTLSHIALVVIIPFLPPCTPPPLPSTPSLNVAFVQESRKSA